MKEVIIINKDEISEMKRSLFDRDYRIKKLKKEVIKLAAIRFLAPVGLAVLLSVLIPKSKSEVE